MKKMLALLLSAIMIIGLLAACGDDISKGDTKLPVGTDEGTQTTAPVTTFTTGELTVNAGAAFVITFDAQGLVLRIDGADERYKEFQEFLNDDSALIGTSCADALGEIIKSAAVKGYLSEAGFVAIKQDHKTGLPDPAFLENVQRSAQKALDAAAPEVALVMITAEQLDANGMIGLPTAKVLVEKFLGGESLTNFDGTSEPINGVYSFTAGVDGREEQVLVNAVIGSVDYGVLEELIDETEPDDTNVPEDTLATTVPEEIPEDTMPAPTEDVGTEG